MTGVPGLELDAVRADVKVALDARPAGLSDIDYAVAVAAAAAVVGPIACERTLPPIAVGLLHPVLLRAQKDVGHLVEGLLERDRVLDDLAAPAARLIAPLEAASAAALGHVR